MGKKGRYLGHRPQGLGRSPTAHVHQPALISLVDEAMDDEQGLLVAIWKLDASIVDGSEERENQ